MTLLWFGARVQGRRVDVVTLCFVCSQVEGAEAIPAPSAPTSMGPVSGVDGRSKRRTSTFGRKLRSLYESMKL